MWQARGIGVAGRAGRRRGHAGAAARRPAPDQARSRRRWSRSRSPACWPPSVNHVVPGARGRHHRHPLSRDGRRPRRQRRSAAAAAADAPLARAAGRAAPPLHLSLRRRCASCSSGAFAVAMLGGIESLLSAVIADGMAGTRHDPDAELLALGIGNVVTPFFGGIPATGAIARTATNFRSGARSPSPSIVHALTVLVAVHRAGAAHRLPADGRPGGAAAAGRLEHVRGEALRAHPARRARAATRCVLLTCFVLTVVFDMVVAVSVGVVLAALLFMRRMAEITHARLTGDGDARAPRRAADLPPTLREEGRHLRHRRPAVLRRRPEGDGEPGRHRRPPQGRSSSGSTTCRSWTPPAWSRWRARSPGCRNGAVSRS